ncbi:MAG: hypothetical protein MPK62_10925 [Alphaproteobacteria bacterium]|nr:hypothetical protein [Alphaproteobacteria bacterium]MDA8031614.1 hypothetical protein [Alphaproteobacteria bacterium]
MTATATTTATAKMSAWADGITRMVFVFSLKGGVKGCDRVRRRGVQFVQ